MAESPEGLPQLSHDQASLEVEKRGLYAKEQEKRSYERYLVTEGEQQRDKDISHALDILGRFSSFGHVSEPTETQQDQLEGQLARLRQEADELGTPEEQQKLREASHSRLVSYAFSAGQLRYAERVINKKRGEMRIRAAFDPDIVNPKTIDEKQLLDQRANDISVILEEDLPYLNPESFMAHNLLKLRHYKKEFNRTGIVPVPFVDEMEEQTLDAIQNNGIVALVGETGTGKTKTATRLGQEIFDLAHPGEEGGPIYVLGHQFTSREDLFASLGLSADVKSPEEAMETAEEAVRRYRERHADLEHDELEQRVSEIRNVALEQSSNVLLHTQEFLGALYQAAEQGKPVVIDEFTYINPALIAGANELMNVRPGQTITTPSGRRITAKEGYCLFLTANVTLADMKRYTNRHGIDAALLNRINGGLIEYNTPPQEDIDSAFALATIPDEDRKEGKRPARRDLFQIALTSLVDTKAQLYAPEETLEQVWHVAQAFKVFQNNFAGKELRGEDKFKGTGGRDFRLQQTHASLRQFTRLLRDWKSDHYAHPIDYYLYKELIRPASAVAPKEAAYFYDILSRKYGFFQGEYWKDKVSINDKDEIVLSSDINRQPPAQEQKLKLYTAQEVAEAFSGVQTPQEIRTLETKGQAVPLNEEQKIEQISKMSQEIEGMKTWLKEFTRSEHDSDNPEKKPGTLELFCMDEAAIMGSKE